MNRFLQFILFFYCAIGFCQNSAFPKLVVEKGQVELTFQNVEINVVGNVADIHLYQSFKTVENSKVQFSFPVDMNANLYELTIYTEKNIYSLDARNMDNIRKQVIAENKKGKSISTKYQDNINFLILQIPDLKEDEEIKIALKYMLNLKVDELDKSFEIPSFLGEFNYKNIQTNYLINIISPTPIYETNLVGFTMKESVISEKYRTFSYNGNEPPKPISVRYQTKGDQADAGMLVYEESGCRYILGAIEPPKYIDPEEIAPREYVFVMDISGSMSGFPLETSKTLITKILHDLKPFEKFNILFFAGSSDFFAKESVYATPENISLAIQMIGTKKSTGNTKLSEALKKVYNYPPDKSYNRVVVLVTDGKLTEEKSLYFELKQNLKFAQYFCFGIGYDLDRKTLQQIAHVAGTDAVLITDQLDAQKEMQNFFDLIRTPLLRNIQVQSKNLNLSETYPSNFNGFLSSASSSFISKECSSQREPKLMLTGINGDEQYTEEFQLSKFDDNSHLNILKYIWAKEKIEYLLQEEERCGARCVQDGRYRNQIIQIGETLNISTPFTSFIQESYTPKGNEKGRKNSLYDNVNNVIVFQNDFDSDFDKIPNTIDDCPYDRGTASRKGCPKTKEENMTLEINRMLEGIEFDFDSYEIKSEFFVKLDTAAEIISANEKQNYIVEGHTDAAGTPEYNMNLSLNRANAVVQYLEKKGVKLKQMQIVGKGDQELKHPECRPHTICSDQKNFENRRVIFKLLN